jgi:PGF-pre-PGF domain-containing protein
LSYNATNNVSGNTESLTTHGAVSGVNLFVNTRYASTRNGTNYTYHFTVENMGNRWDTINITYTNPDNAEFIGIQSCSPWACEDKTNVTIAPGSPDNVAYPDSIRVTMNESDVGAYTMVVTATSMNNKTVSDSITIRTIVHGPDHPDSAIIDSAISGSTIYRSLVNGSNVTDSNISDSLVYSSNVSNTNLSEVVLRGARVENGVIYCGNITIKNVTYGVTSPLSIEGGVVTGSDIEDSTLIGMSGRKLDVEAEDSNLSATLFAGNDYFLGSMWFQRSAIHPDGAASQTNNLGGYSWITPSTNVEESMEWVLMKIYYDESELPQGAREEDLKFQFYNTTARQWEFLNKTFVDGFANNAAWANQSGNWSITGDGRYNGSSNGTAISVVNETVTSGNTYIQVRFNVTNGTTENAFVVFNYTDPSDFYYAGVRNHTSNSSFNLVIGHYNGIWNDVNWSEVNLSRPLEYQIVVFIEDGVVSLVVNGTKKAYHTFPGLYGGKIGLAVCNTTTYFDDFTVYHPRSGVNTEENYVWGNSTHFSVYGIQSSIYGISSSVYGLNPKSNPSTTSGPSGGGGGGGGGASKGVVIKKIEAGSFGTAVFDLADTGYISEIDIYSKDTVYNVKVVAEPVEKKPYSTMPDPEGVVKSYLKLTKAGISNTQMEKAEVRFQINLTWMKENDIGQDSVLLRRDATSKWEDLETTYLSEDEEFAYYSAVTPGFSYFVITGKEGSGYKEPVEEIAAPVETEAPPVVTTVPPKPTAAPVKTPAATVRPETPAPEPEKKGICGPGLILWLSLVPVALRRRRGF